MAKIKFNPIVEQVSGSFGDIVFRRSGEGLIIAHRPGERGAPSETQAAQRERFRQAVLYAQGVLADPTSRAVYEAAAAHKGKPVFAMIIADWFHAPEILEIDLGGWSGQAGQPIRIRAVDDVQVASVQVSIRDGNDAVLEQGAATRAEGLWWQYTTTTAAGGSPNVLASAQDLPGHITQVTKAKQ